MRLWLYINYLIISVKNGIWNFIELEVSTERWKSNMDHRQATRWDNTNFQISSEIHLTCPSLQTAGIRFQSNWIFLFVVFLRSKLPNAKQTNWKILVLSIPSKHILLPLSLRSPLGVHRAGRLPTAWPKKWGGGPFRPSQNRIKLKGPYLVHSSLSYLQQT